MFESSCEVALEIFIPQIPVNPRKIVTFASRFLANRLPAGKAESPMACLDSLLDVQN